jgi:hypothetical protein
VTCIERDLEFDLENDQRACLYGLNPEETYNPTDVRRVSQIFDKPQLFVGGGVGVNDIVQGALGDCWFLSALATMCASKEKIIEQLCVAVSYFEGLSKCASSFFTQRDEDVGIYGFVFFRDLVPVSVIIDE